MSVRKKNGDIVAIIASLFIALLLTAALIYGSEHRRKQDLEKFHEKAVREALQAQTPKPIQSYAGASAPTIQHIQLKSSDQDIKSFGETIRMMPNDPNTPLMTNYLDEDQEENDNENVKEKDKEVDKQPANGQENKPHISNTIVAAKTTNTETKTKENLSTAAALTKDKETVKMNTKTDTKDKDLMSTDNTNQSETKDTAKISTSTSSSTVNPISINSTPSQNTVSPTPPPPPPPKQPVPTLSENIVPFQPQAPSKVQEVNNDDDDRIEAIKRSVLEKLAKEAEAKREKELSQLTTAPSATQQLPPTPQPPPPPPPILSAPKPKRHRSSAIFFDPVPGLFPKLLVDRFYKKRRVQVIMYGPNNSKKEYVVEGDKADQLFGKGVTTGQHVVGNENHVENHTENHVDNHTENRVDNHTENHTENHADNPTETTPTTTTVTK